MVDEHLDDGAVTTTTGAVQRRQAVLVHTTQPPYRHLYANHSFPHCKNDYWILFFLIHDFYEHLKASKNPLVTSVIAKVQILFQNWTKDETKYNKQKILRSWGQHLNVLKKTKFTGTL